MLKKLLLYSVIAIGISVCPIGSYAHSVHDIEDSALYYLHLIDTNNLYFSAYKRGIEDSLDAYNDRLQSYLLKNCAKQPATLKASFDKLTKEGMRIVTAEDNKFRIYSWDDMTGGTMHSFISIVQYQTKDGIKAQLVPYKIDDGADGNPGYFYSNVYAVKTKDNKTIYVAIRNAMYSTKDVAMGIQAFEIKGSTINTIKFFKTTNSFLNNFDCGYNYFSNYDTRETNPVIHLSPDKQKLYVAIVSNEKVTSKWLVYKFDGYKFVFDKNAK